MNRQNAWGVPPVIVQNHSMDSQRWCDFPLRDDDIVICTWAKSGTTWVQQIVAGLLFCGQKHDPVTDLSPWIEHRFNPLGPMLRKLDDQTHRRFLKSHLCAEALPFRPTVRYIYVGRDGRDAVWSWHNHHLNLNESVYSAMERTPGLVGDPLRRPTADVREYYLTWLARDGYPLWPFWTHVSSWWHLRNRPNVLLLHYEQLKNSFQSCLKTLAEFLNVDLSPHLSAHIETSCSFSHMKKHAEAFLPLYANALSEGASTFLNRGQSGYWRGVLTPADVERYESTASAKLGASCAHWLAGGTRE